MTALKEVWKDISGFENSHEAVAQTTDDMEHCYLCGRPRECVHHIFFGPLRHIADKLRLVVPLCNDCHMFGRNAVHQNRGIDLELKRTAQLRYEETHSREDWFEKIGRNYL